MMSSRQIFRFLRQPQRILSGRWANQKFKRCLAIEPMEERRLLTTIDLAALVAGQGSTIFGADAFDQIGWYVSGAGDVNGDELLF